jgi:O-Antigen ligase
MTKTQWNKILEGLQFTGFALLIASLPLSNFFMSFASFWLVGVWILYLITDLKQGNPIQQRFKVFTTNRYALLLTSLYVLPLIGLLWTTDFKYAFWDLRMKLPLLFMPFLLTTLRPLSTRSYRALIGIFILSLTFAVLWCLSIYWQLQPRKIKDVREISVFISHVRFCLLLVIGMCFLFAEAWDKPNGKTLSIMLALLYGYFIYVIGSMTGVIVLSALLLWLLVRSIWRTSNKKIRYTLMATLLVLISGTGYYLRSSYHAYFDVPDFATYTSDKQSILGETYEHNPQYPVIENGHYSMTHIAWGEMYNTWAARSAISPDSLDGKGHILKGTMIRYLASKGLRKDFQGISSLSDQDVKAIENGMISYDESTKGGLKKRLGSIFFEIANYRAGGSPAGHSVIQRLEFWKTAWHIIQENPIIGVGTGDVKSAFAEMYEKDHTQLDKEFRLRAHNQYLTMWLTYGIAGLLLMLAVVLVPLFFMKKKSLLLTAFVIISSLSFITEDTLESQAGVMFFAFFSVFLSLTIQRSDQKSQTPPAQQ